MALTKIGILGAGQLAQMLALSGYNLNMRFALYNFDGEATAGIGDIFEAKSGASIDDFIKSVDCVTYEFENLPIEAVEKISASVGLYPNAKSLRTSQHRGREKSFFTDLGLKVADFIIAKSAQQLQDFFAEKSKLGKDCIVKTCQFGYDGKGQKVLSAIRVFDFEAIWSELGGNEFGELLIEEKLNFTRELSIVAVRNKSGQIAFYPLVENQHKDGILRYTLAPAPKISENLQNIAENYAGSIMENLDYVGTMALELFEVEGNLLVNEMAPRVHNSGHWSQDADCVSQFENHLRAIADLPLGNTKPKLKTLMLNLIGDLPEQKTVLSYGNANLHLYGKTGRAGRKVGHINLTNTNYKELIEEAKTLAQKLNLPEPNLTNS